MWQHGGSGPPRLWVSPPWHALLALTVHGLVGAGPNPFAAATDHIDRHCRAGSHTRDAVGLNSGLLRIIMTFGHATARRRWRNRCHPREGD
jgi:hypothetical protein